MRCHLGKKFRSLEESQECDQVFGHALPETPELGYADLNGTLSVYLHLS